MFQSRTCPISAIARILGRKWALELLFYLRQHNRFCELQAAAGGLSPATLTRRLRQLERDGLVTRSLVSTAPVQIEYRLSEKGLALGPVLDALAEWSHRWLSDEHQGETA
ncbi:MAG TPA: helix-turn-helix domain-containing protein [Anaerolineales bacterium]|nr:helix-turn-helix domain-containing protein [Anaerolineales bacterium]